MMSGTEIAMPKIQVAAATHQAIGMLIFFFFGNTIATNLSALIAIKLKTPPSSKEPKCNKIYCTLLSKIIYDK